MEGRDRTLHSEVQVEHVPGGGGPVQEVHRKNDWRSDTNENITFPPSNVVTRGNNFQYMCQMNPPLQASCAELSISGLQGVIIQSTFKKKLITMN